MLKSISNTKTLQLSNSSTGVTLKKGTDHVLEQHEIINLIRRILGKRVRLIEEYKNKQIPVFEVKYGDITHIFTMSNITYMGKGISFSNPETLKRIQLQSWFRKLYNQYTSQPNTKVHFMGVYYFSRKYVFADFCAKDYIDKKWKTTTSTHIYLNDILQGYNQGIFEKTDKYGNHISTIKLECFENYFKGEYEKRSVIDRIEEISLEMPKDWITAEKAIPFMRSLEHEDTKEFTSFNNWRQNLWNGWIIEAYYSKLASHFTGNDSVLYIDTCDEKQIQDKYKSYDLDLLLTNEDGKTFLGDLKGVSINVEKPQGKTLLNDEKHVNEAISKFERIWFVFYIQKSKPGKTNNYEMVKWRNAYIEKIDGKSRDPLSGKSTPHSIQIDEIVVIELNEVTKDRYFEIGKQWGKNSNQKDRNRKYKISKHLLKQLTEDDSFVIYRKKFEKID